MNADQLDADIITAVPLIRNGYQPFGGGLQILALGDDVSNLGGRQGTMQTVGAKHQHILRVYLDLRGFGRYHQVSPYGAAEYVTGGRFCCLLGGKHSKILLVSSQGVIPGERSCASVPYEITARVSYVADDRLVEAQCAQNQRSRHATYNLS